MTGIQAFIGTNASILSVAFFAVAGVAALGFIVAAFVGSRGPAKNESMLDELVLGERQRNRDGYTSNIDKSKFLGAIGVCATDLRPAGTITVEGEPVDVVTEGNFIKQGDIVKVINVDSSRVLVRQI